MAKIKIKLYTHHFTYTEEGTSERQGKPNFFHVLFMPFKMLLAVCFGFGIFLVKSSLLLVSILARISYLAGLLIVYPFTFFKRMRSAHSALAGEIVTTTNVIESKFKKFKTPQFAYTIVVFLVLCGTVLGSFNVAALYTKGQGLKARVLGQTNSAIQALEEGKALLGEQEVSGAQRAFDKALFEFAATRSSLDTAGTALSLVLEVVPAKNDAEYMLRAGELLSRGARKLTSVYEGVRQISATGSGIASPNGLSTDLKSIGWGITSAGQDITEAHGYLLKINSNSVPETMRGKFVEARELVGKATSALDVVGSIVGLAQHIFSGNQHIVLFFQNSNELRSTGGFLGSFADFTTKEGSISDLRVSSIYDLDGQLKEVLLPPLPMFMVNQRLFLRDSNWFVHFPDSAKVMSELYIKSGGQKPDIIVAATPNLIVDILKVTGPIFIPGYNVTLDSDNFVEQTQIETSINYDKLENKPKKMLSDLLPLLITQVSNLPRDRQFLVLSAVQQNLVQGNILLYSSNSEIQKDFSDFGWSGEVLPSDRDFLYISRSNLGGTKTDSYVTEEVHLESNISSSGEVINTLRFTRTNPLPPVESMTNTSFIRVLVPNGSELIHNTGFSPQPFVIDFQPKGNIHPQVAEWEKGSVKDVVSGTLIGTESGKTFFANWLVLKGGESKTVEISYRLPYRLAALDHTSLIVQNQPGSKEFPMTYSIRFPGRFVHWKNFAPSTADLSTFSVESKIRQNTFYGLVLEQKE